MKTSTKRRTARKPSIKAAAKRNGTKSGTKGRIKKSCPSGLSTVLAALMVYGGFGTLFAVMSHNMIPRRESALHAAPATTHTLASRSAKSPGENTQAFPESLYGGATVSPEDAILLFCSKSALKEPKNRPTPAVMEAAKTILDTPDIGKHLSAEKTIDAEITEQSQANAEAPDSIEWLQASVKAEVDDQARRMARN